MIRCESITRNYRGCLALKGVSFHVAPGEFIAIMGPSGCGKSTALNILGLLDRPTTGHYHLHGEDASRMNDWERTVIRREKVGFVFQSFNLLPRLSALGNVRLPMSYAGMEARYAETRSKELLTRVGLAKRFSHAPPELSGGERQRVAIARALANRPVVLLADEPTGNLDSKSSEEILALFKELHQEGLTIILVTHDLHIAKSAQRILRLKDGLLESS